MAHEIDSDAIGCEIAAAIKAYVERHVSRLVARNIELEARIKSLEARPMVKYCGVYAPGQSYPENSLVTKAGSLWIAKQTTDACPGDGAPDAWQLCVRKGRDGKDATR